jgi:hypothetical protein
MVRVYQAALTIRDIAGSAGTTVYTLRAKPLRALLAMLSTRITYLKESRITAKTLEWENVFITVGTLLYLTTSFMPILNSGVPSLKSGAEGGVRRAMYTTTS